MYTGSNQFKFGINYMSSGAGSMRRACFCYTTNTNYMGATVLSAVQARLNVPTARADVAILFLGADDARARGFADLCGRHGILFQVITPQGIDDLPIHFARHFLDRFLPPEITDIVHVDGDTQIAGPLEPLLDIPLAPGRVLAVPDPMSVMIHHPSRAWRARRAYFRSIGIAEDRLDRYCNSGVFRIARTDAGAVGRECVRLCRERGAALRFSEQDALNIAFGSAIDLISFRWNFPAFFLNGSYDAVIAPHVIHYMSNPRPWQGAFLPWGRPAHRVYREMAQNHPELAGLLQPLRGWPALRYRAQQRAKHLIESRTWTRLPVRERVARFEREAMA